MPRPLLLLSLTLLGAAGCASPAPRAHGCPAGAWGWWSGSLEECSWNRLLRADRGENY